MKAFGDGFMERRCYLEGDRRTEAKKAEQVVTV